MKENRKGFIKKSSALTALSLTGIGIAGAAMNACTGADESAFERVKKDPSPESRMKMALQARTEPSEEDLRFIQQMGLDQVVLWTNGSKASARALDLSKLDTEGYGRWGGKRYTTPLSHEREYSRDETWENYEYFIRKAAPVAEEQGVHIGIHPDDPPVPELAGVPRCIFSSFDGYADMYKVLKALRKVDFDGIFMADHIPRMVNGAGTPFTVGYMKAMLERVNAEA